jgi:hypothetical protein
MGQYRERINASKTPCIVASKCHCKAWVAIWSVVLLSFGLCVPSNSVARDIHHSIDRSYTVHVSYKSTDAALPYFGGDDFTIGLSGSKMILSKSESKGGRHSGALIPKIGGKACSLWNYTTIEGFKAKTSFIRTCFSVVALSANSWRIDAHSTEGLPERQHDPWKLFSFLFRASGGACSVKLLGAAWGNSTGVTASMVNPTHEACE